MKKTLRSAVVLGTALVTLAGFVGCKTQLVETDYATADSYDEAIAQFLEKTEVSFVDLDSREYFLTGKEGIASILTEKLSSSFARTVSETDKVIDANEMVGILSCQIESMDLPELLEPNEDDLIRIQKDFPDLTLDEIIENIDTISNLYQKEIGLKALDSVVATCAIEQSDCRAAVYENGLLFDKITPLELAICLLHPFSALSLPESKDKAIALTAQYMGSGTTGDDKGDAFRHAIWNVTLAKLGWGHKEAKLRWAKEITEAHEKGVRYTGAPSEMDLHNNNAGRHVYDTMSTKQIKKLFCFPIEVGVNEPSYEQACNAVKGLATSATFVDMTQDLNKVKAAIAEVPMYKLVYIIKDDKKY